MEAEVTLVLLPELTMQRVRTLSHTPASPLHFLLFLFSYSLSQQGQNQETVCRKHVFGRKHLYCFK